MPLAWKDRVQQAITAGGTGTLTLGAATAGYRALEAADSGQTFAGFIADGAAWETGLYTYTHATASLARTALYASSSGAAINATTSAVWSHGLTAAGALSADLAAQGAVPGGRLTVVSGSAAPSGDVVGASTIYYTPYVSDVLPLWDGARWRCVAFAETALPLGTMTADMPYDVFGYVTPGGVLALESAAWTSGTARATALSRLAGRWCKSGDPTRLYLGTFRTTSTTTTEDSARRRLVWNAYNRRARHVRRLDSTGSWTYASPVWRQARASSLNQVEVVAGLQEDAIHLQVAVVASGAGVAALLGVGVNSTTANASGALGSQSVAVPSSAFSQANTAYSDIAPLGYSYFAWLEMCSGTATITWYGSSTGEGYTAGMIGTWPT